MALREKIFNEIFTLRRLFLWGNVILLGWFLAALAVDAERGWKDYQKEFKGKEIERWEAVLSNAQSDEEKKTALKELKLAKSMPMEIRQMWIQELDSVDRCITCHMGYDPLANPTLETPYLEHPYAAPAGTKGSDIHRLHRFDQFGCVVCHSGQGLATEVKAAHGQVLHWEKPLLKGTLLQASCAKCHDNVKELTIQSVNYTSEIVRAKELFREHGCIGCHQIGGEGGPISVDLREETSVKPLSRIDFNYSGLSHDEHTLSNWIKIHMTQDPAVFVPGDPTAEFNTEPIPPSAMPPYLLPEADADAITAYILSLNHKDIPQPFRTTTSDEPKPVFASSVNRGRYVYEEYGCGGCHGNDARGGVRNFNYQYDVTPNIRKVVGQYSREELKEKIRVGVPIVAKNNPEGPNPPLYMPAWKDKLTDGELEDLVTYLFSIKE